MTAKSGGGHVDARRALRLAGVRYLRSRRSVLSLSTTSSSAAVLADSHSLSAFDLRVGFGMPPLRGAARVHEDDGDDRSTSRARRDRRREALQRAQGNRTDAAALLGLNRTTLVEKLRRYG